MTDTDGIGARGYRRQIIQPTHHRVAVVHRAEHLHEQLVLPRIDAADDNAIMPEGQRLKMRNTYRGHPKAKRQPTRSRDRDADPGEVPRPDADANRSQIAIGHICAGQHLGT